MLFDSARAVSSVAGIKTQKDAMQACGMQPEFASHLLLQSYAFGVCIILRAGNPPVYNQQRSAKSGINLSKTSNQGFFKGSIAENKAFTRVQLNQKTGRFEAIGLHLKDRAALNLPLSSPEYQHTVQLKITLLDLLREIDDGGDLEVLNYNAQTQQLLLKYKENKGDPAFQGQFVLKLNENIEAPPQFYSRPWDRPENHPHWDPVHLLIKKPDTLATLPDETYQHIANQVFNLYYTEERTNTPLDSELQKATVFASTPKTANDFLNAMGSSHPRYDKVAHLKKLSAILAALTPEEIAGVYAQCQLIITGDWDGLVLGHPLRIRKAYRTEFNTLDTKHSLNEMILLLNTTMEYFAFLKNEALLKKPEERNGFDSLLLDISDPNDLFSDFALERAGCITPHEFLFLQTLNHSYRLETNAYYGEKNLLEDLQAALSEGLAEFGKENIIDFNSLQDKTDWVIQRYHDKIAAKRPNPAVLAVWDDHLSKHFQKALFSGEENYRIPHPNYDHNINDLFRHGFEMRNPKGCSLEGAWFMVAPDGGLLYGETQEQLIEVMLIPGFLESNLISVNFSADMARGWAKVIARQLSLGQEIPDKTRANYEVFKQNEAKEAVVPGKMARKLSLNNLPFFKSKSQEPPNKNDENQFKKG
ncbi:MAG: hypothetical protein WC785_01860 [Tatlockia sp.]